MKNQTNRLFIIITFFLLSNPLYAQRSNISCLSRNYEKLNDLKLEDKDKYDDLNGVGGLYQDVKVEIQNGSLRKVSDLRINDKIKVYNHLEKSYRFTDILRIYKINTSTCIKFNEYSDKSLIVGTNQEFAQIRPGHVGISVHATRVNPGDRIKHPRGSFQVYSSSQVKGWFTLYDIEIEKGNYIYLPEYDGLLSYHKNMSISEKDYKQKQGLDTMAQIVGTIIGLPCLILCAWAG